MKAWSPELGFDKDSMLSFPEGPDAIVIKELGLKDHICNGFWDLSP